MREDRWIRDRCNQAVKVTYLVYEVLTMIVTERLSTNDTVQIRFHKLLNEINLLEIFDVGWLEYVEDRDDIFMIEMTK